MRMPENIEGQDDAEHQVPPELVSALKRLPQKRPFVPPAVDEAVFRAARRHLGKGQPERPELSSYEWTRDSLRRLLRLAPWPVAIALVTVALLTFHFLSSGLRPTSDSVPAELSRNTHMDILDALILAKRLQSGPVGEQRWDVNGDGVVDERDVQTIAVQVVRLDKGGRS